MTSVTGYTSFQVSTNIFIPEKEDQGRVRITELFRDHAEAINRREVANYDPAVSPTGQQWPPNPGQNNRASTQRVIVPVTISNASSPQSFPHGIKVGARGFTKISGVVGNGSSKWVPVPLSTDIVINVTASNVVITTSSGAYDGYTGQIILEFFPG